MIGLQPALLDYLRRNFKVRVVDMNPQNIRTEKYGVIIEDAKTKTEELKEWSCIISDRK
ncbi:hypothetical protein [Natranaerobius trueperi]|uniref:hypothetical protein n=1 Tax=Natranaerobius trueperi TaxID=759412 RepID=UPI0013030C2D|nr:hypothetical protein [Natranaerobius trueperi]